jgi:uncharacterized repeat protein (TIGR03803 family)
MKSARETRILAGAFSIVLLLNALRVQAQTTTARITQLFAFPCSSSGICSQGAEPNQLIQASDGNFYGVAGHTSVDGTVTNGTIFRITSGGRLTLLHTFQSTNGNPINPATALVEANDGFLYGTTFDGGDANQGVLFRIQKNGTGFEIVHSFCSEANCADGAGPESLILGHDGNLYGVAGTNSGTVIFRFAPPATFSIAMSFPSPSGAPDNITQGAGGNFYAVSLAGDLTDVERITPSGQITVLGDIQPQGIDPCHGSTSLLQVAAGNLYAMMGCYQIEQAQFYEVALSGGLQEFPRLGHTGELITPIRASDGNLWTIQTGLDEVIAAPPSSGTIVRSFAFSGANGSNAEASVVQGADGKIYGTASSGGTGQNPAGTVWVLDAGLRAPRPAIAAFTPAGGAVGTKVLIRGDHFISATGVTFNGMNATFQVLNRNFIVATVPVDANTGPIAISNPGGNSSSSQNFEVR